MQLRAEKRNSMAKVLIVEDDATLRSAYETVLTMEGFEVSSAADGLEGLRQALEMKPDLIILDMLMPNMDGMQFLATFKQQNQNPGTKIIVFSNIAAPEKMKEAQDLGAMKYLTKATFTPKEMVATIKEALGGSAEETKPGE